MKGILSMLLFLFACSVSHAGFQGINSSTDLKLFNKLQCSTGLTCSRNGDKFKIIADGVASNGDFTITGTEGNDGILNLKSDDSDDSGDDWAVKAQASGNALVIQNDTSGSLATKLTVSTGGNVTFTGNIVGYYSPLVVASATTATAAQCGSTFYNTGAAEIDLPQASTVPGCEYHFAVLNASNLDIDPNATDTVLITTDAAGDRVRSSSVGSHITIKAITAGNWVEVGKSGTWTDAN